MLSVPVIPRLPLTVTLSANVISLTDAPMLITDAAPAKFTVVALLLIRLKVAALVVISPPSTFRSRSISTLLLMLVVPVVAPISNVVAAFAKFTVVAVVLIRLNDVAVVVKSPPLTAKSSVVVKLFLTVVVPLVAPTVSVVAAPPKLIDVAVVLNNVIVALAATMPVVNVGLVPNTRAPLPVSSLITPAS